MQTSLAFVPSVTYLRNAKTKKLPLYITTYDDLGNTIQKLFMPLDYNAQSIEGYFDFMEPNIYAGLPQWYSISFENPSVSVSNYPFLRISLDSNL